MNCTGKNCIMQRGTVNPITCQCVDYCPEATPLDIKNMREVITTLIAWAATEGIGYTTATELMNKLYSGCEDANE